MGLPGQHTIIVYTMRYGTEWANNRNNHVHSSALKLNSIIKPLAPSSIIAIYDPVFVSVHRLACCQSYSIAPTK